MDLLIFDFDGVIVNTFTIAFEIEKNLRGGLLTEEEYRDFFNGNVYTKLKEEEITPFFKQFIPRLMQEPPAAGMVDLIRKLKSAGRKMVVVSSTMDEPIKQYLEKQGIADCFLRIYGATTSKSKNHKLMSALADNQVEASQAVFITDTLGDIREATNLHIPAIAVTWGYHPAETLEQGNPKVIVKTVQKLEAVLK